MQVRQSEIISWLNHPVTSAIHKKLNQLLVAEKNALISGAYLGNHDKTAYSIGVIAGLTECLEIKPEEVFFNEKSEANRPQSFD